MPRKKSCVTSPRFRPTLQARSRRTLDRLLDAAESLLRDRSFDDLTIADCVRRARSSVGAFYARFLDKDALLDALYDRHQAQVTAALGQALDPKHWINDPVSRIVEQLVHELVKLHVAKRGLLRALVLHGHMRPDWRYDDLAARSQLSVARVGELIGSRRTEIAHPAPKAAASLGYLMVLATLREKLLFGESTASALDMDAPRLERELVRAYLAYLGVATIASAPCRRRTKETDA